MVDVIYSSDNVIVTGGPSSIDLNINSGSRGIRGSRIYSIPGDPRTLSTQELPSDLLEYDLAIVVDSASNEAFTIFQKTGSSPQSWEPLPPLALNVFSAKETIVFDSNGIALARVPVSTIFDLEEYTVDQFAVQYQIENEAETVSPKPISSAMSLSIIPDLENNLQNLVAVIKAAEFDGTSWTSLSSTTRTIHAFVTVV